MDLTSIALRTLAIICELWPELSKLLSDVAEHPDFKGDAIAAQVAAALPAYSESEAAAATLRDGGHA